MDSRQIFNEKLKSKEWFLSTDNSITQMITDLPDEYNGFKKKLVDIEDQNSIGQVIRATECKLIGSQIWVKIELRSNINNQTITSEFICWKNGDNPLSRGVVIVEEDGETIGLLLENKFNLVTFKDEVKSFTIAYPEFQQGSLIKLPEKLTASLGDYSIKKYYDLGNIEPENGLISGQTGIFAVKISLKNLGSVNKNRITFVSLEEIQDIIERIKDAYLLSIIAKLKFMDIL